MKEHYDAKALVEAILDGDLTFDAALEQHLDDDDADLERINAALCYFNLNQLDKVLDADGPTVAEVIEQSGLGPFAPLLNDKEPDRHNDIQYPVGTLVDFYGEVCRVIGRRRTTILAMPAEDDFEVFLESVDGKPKYFFGESMVSDENDGDEDDDE